MIHYIKRDITKTLTGVIAHGCNCQSVMGGGVALAIRKKWPQIYESYMSYRQGPSILGDVDVVKITPELFVVNCWTQVYYGGGDKRYASPEAIDQALESVYEIADVYDLPVVIPQIGCGLAGLDWKVDVEPIVAKYDSLHENVDTVVCLWG